MSTFDNLKETLTNKLDEIKNDLGNDSTEQHNTDALNSDSNDSGLNQDTYDASAHDPHNERIEEESLSDSIPEEDSVERLETDYDLNQEINSVDDYTALNDSYAGLDDTSSDHERANENLITENESLSAEDDYVSSLDEGSDLDEHDSQLHEEDVLLSENQGNPEDLVYSNVEDENGEVKPFGTS